MENQKKPKTSHFWNTCPLNKDFFPEEPCSLGNRKNSPCTWNLSSKKYNFCFWSYVNKNSNCLGEMPELSISEIASLLGLTLNEAQKELRHAHKDLENILKGLGEWETFQEEIRDN